MKYNEWCLAALTLAMCTQRMSIAAGNIFYGLAILFFLLHLYQRHQAGETFTVPKDCKRYFLVYGLYALLLLPSVFFSVDPGRSLSKFADYFIGRIWVLPILLFLKIDAEAIKKALLVYIGFLAFDGLWTFGERIYTHGFRSNGLGDGWLRAASIVATVFPATLVLWLTKKVSFPGRKYLIGCAVLMVLGALGSGTRSSWVGMLAVLPFILYEGFVSSPKKAAAIVAILCCFGMFMYQTPALHERFISIANITTNRSNGDRVEAWKVGAEMVKARPLTGFGILEGGRVYLAHYRTKADTQGLNHFHSNYVQTAVDSGLPGLTGLLVFLLYNFWNFRHLGNPYELIGFCAWVGFCAVGLFDYTLGISAAVKALWFMTGCCMRLRETV